MVANGLKLLKGASERFGDPAFLDKSVATAALTDGLIKTTFFTIRTQRLL